jgi:hypothetical protein
MTMAAPIRSFACIEPGASNWSSWELILLAGPSKTICELFRVVGEMAIFANNRSSTQDDFTKCLVMSIEGSTS